LYQIVTEKDIFEMGSKVLAQSADKKAVDFSGARASFFVGPSILN